MRTSTIKIALAISAALLISASAVLWYGLYEVGQKTAVIVELSDQIKQEQLKVDHFQALKKLASTTVAARLRLDRAFLKSEEVASFASYLERLATSAGATAKITSYSSSQNGDSVFATENLNATLNISGPWYAVNNAVRLLESIPYASAIDAVSYTKGASEEAGKALSNAPWTANVSLRVVKYKQ